MKDERLRVVIPAIPGAILELIFPDGTETHETNAIEEDGEPAFEFVVSHPDGITLDDVEWRV